MSRNEKRIRDALAAIGHAPSSVRWEPVGKQMEMCGREGGWIVNDFHPVGYNVEQALATIKEFPQWFPPGSDDDGDDGIESD